jgi:extradiol dioxygenase family protein
LLDDLGAQTCLHIELSSYPKSYKYRRFWYSRFLFSEVKPGMLLVVDDWMALSRQLEVARSRWHEENKARRQGDQRSLALAFWITPDESGLPLKKHIASAWSMVRRPSSER